ncbi:hypothetical protein BYT27DRAFT_7202478 [Phlegmacium glaucopus]|nr:hypothetical protein BYT27DRAFT_7202478 [Phlegmacium glaucopus]
MKTTLPNLSYNPIGFVWSEVFHSSGYTKERAFPRTDLEQFVPWDTFEREINEGIGTRMSAMNIPLGAEYDIGPLLKTQPRVVNEEGVREQANMQLHYLVVEVLNILGIEGWFSPSDSGNNQIVGEPDFSWLRGTTMHPRAVVEYKTKWAAPLEDLPAYFQHEAHKNANIRERQSIDAVFQLYGYMTFNDNKYGILSNMQYAWFFQRIETADSKSKTLQYYGPINFHVDSVHSPSMLKAFVGTILLAETASTWFHSSPTSDKAPRGRYFGATPTAIRDRDAAIAKAQSYHSVVVDGSYQVLPLDPRLCHFDRSAVRHAPQRGCTLKAKLLRGILAGGNLNVFCKIVDLFRRRDSIDALNVEVRNYATLQDLQGIVIPRVRGYYDVWGLLRLLALEDVGTAIPEDGEIDTRTRALMKSALARIHSAGYVHGDIARRNFCKKADVVFLVDLETLVVGSPVEMDDELAR